MHSKKLEFVDVFTTVYCALSFLLSHPVVFRSGSGGESRSIDFYVHVDARSKVDGALFCVRRGTDVTGQQGGAQQGIASKSLFHAYHTVSGLAHTVTTVRKVICFLAAHPSVTI